MSEGSEACASRLDLTRYDLCSDLSDELELQLPVFGAESREADRVARHVESDDGDKSCQRGFFAGFERVVNVLEGESEYLGLFGDNLGLEGALARVHALFYVELADDVFSLQQHWLLLGHLLIPLLDLTSVDDVDRVDALVGLHDHVVFLEELGSKFVS